MDGIPALTLGDLVIEIFHSVPNKIEQPKEELGRNPLQATKPNMHNPIQCKHTNVVPTDIDHIPSNTIHSGAGATLYVFEDNEETWKTQNQHQMDFLCNFGSQTFVPRSKKRTSVSHSSTEAELLSLDAGLHMDGIPALDLWDLVIEVFHSSPTQSKKTKDQARGSLRDTTSNKHTQNQTEEPTNQNLVE